MSKCLFISTPPNRYQWWRQVTLWKCVCSVRQSPRKDPRARSNPSTAALLTACWASSKRTGSEVSTGEPSRSCWGTARPSAFTSWRTKPPPSSCPTLVIKSPVSVDRNCRKTVVVIRTAVPWLSCRVLSPLHTDALEEVVLMAAFWIWRYFKLFFLKLLISLIFLFA